jgi:predicted transcriptional regulator
MSGVYKIYRHDSQPFAQVPNSAIRDPEITPNAFRLLAYLMSHKEGYELTYGQIERQTTLGRYAINEAIKILTNKGWLRTERTKKDNGQFGPTSFHILNPDEPEQVDSVADGSSEDDSTMEQPTDIKNTNYLDKTKSKEKQRERRASKISDDWKPTQKIIDDYQMKYKGLNHQKELEKFINYYQSKDEARKDWDASYRNWLLNAMDYQGIKPEDNNKPLPKLFVGRIK